jgi:hypothetical protein
MITALLAAYLMVLTNSSAPLYVTPCAQCHTYQCVGTPQPDGTSDLVCTGVEEPL